MSDTLLSPDEPAPFTVVNPEGASPFLLICDHAGKRIPRRLGTLGLPPAEIERHIGWDIGALPVAEQLSELLDATLISQTWSRLVIDCNRPPAAVSSIPLVSEATDIPGNQGLSAAQKRARQQEIFTLTMKRSAGSWRNVVCAGRQPVLSLCTVSRRYIWTYRVPGISACCITACLPILRHCWRN